mmetsp:Transcript_36645/g.86002  ORF Transcript_36645/g.86002 Transcript_36645/m.86002 type:complete len:206 (-) Transcript_36645:411-1028(-)
MHPRVLHCPRAPRGLRTRRKFPRTLRWNSQTPQRPRTLGRRSRTPQCPGTPHGLLRFPAQTEEPAELARRSQKPSLRRHPKRGKTRGPQRAASQSPPACPLPVPSHRLSHPSPRRRATVSLHSPPARLLWPIAAAARGSLLVSCSLFPDSCALHPASTHVWGRRACAPSPDRDCRRRHRCPRCCHAQSQARSLQAGCPQADYPAS